VKLIMTRNVETINTKDSITNAVTKMTSKGVGALPIVDSDHKIAGIVSERDFVLLMAGVLNDEKVGDYMHNNVITTTPGTRIEGASKIMVRNKLRRIPVVGEERKTPHPEEDKIVGIVTATDILEFLGKNSAFHHMITNSGEEILNTTITEIMEHEVITSTPITRLGDVCDLMEEKGIGGMPVVQNGELRGIITESDILRAVSS
jgi:CBS domain-containing protein